MTFIEFLSRIVDAAFWMNVNVVDLNHTIVFWTPRDERSSEWWSPWQEKST